MRLPRIRSARRQSSSDPPFVRSRVCFMISALLTDLYQLTMAHGYFRSGRVRDEAVFHLSFRKHPFEGSYAIAAGLDAVIDLVEGFRFQAEDVDYLASLAGDDQNPIFAADFLDYLRTLELRVDIDALPEGTLVFANEPLVRVRGRLLEAQLLETALLNLINFQTLVATKATRVCLAAGANQCWSSDFAGHRASTGPSPPVAPRISAAARRPATCSPANATVSRCAAPTPTAG